MIILISLVIIMSVSIVIAYKAERESALEITGTIIAVLAGTICLCSIVTVFMVRASTDIEISHHKIMHKTITEARKNNLSSIERAALLNKIIETNQKLIKSRYWNNSLFDIWIPDEVDQLKELR